MLQRATRRLAMAAALMGPAAGCAAAAAARPAAPRPAPPPAWVAGESPTGDALCGLGVAGAGLTPDAPLPRALAAQRASANLAGTLATQMQEAIVDVQDRDGSDVQLARLARVDAELLQRVAAGSRFDTWVDSAGLGPYASPGFVYVRACIAAADAQGRFGVAARQLAAPEPLAGPQPPPWLHAVGAQPGGRLCAVGRALPTFFADDTFAVVAQDVRQQLADVVTTWVSSYAEDICGSRSDTTREVTVASTAALSRGVVVTRFWYDVEGRGPDRTPRATYGWGCTYPIELLQVALDAAAAHSDGPARARLLAARSHADAAFAALTATPQEGAAAAPGAGAVADDTAELAP